MAFRHIVALVAVLFPTAAYGQASLSLGGAIPLAPESLTQTYNHGFGASGSFPLPIRNLIIQPRLTAGFDVLQTDEEFLERRGEELGIDIEGGALSMIHVGFDVQFIRPNGTVKPYISPFLGFAIISVEDVSLGGISFQRQESATGFTLGGAVGLAVRLPPGPHVIVEGRVLHAFTDVESTTWLPLRAGIAFDLD